MRRVLLLIAALCLAFAPAPFPKPDTSKEDLKKMQGAWVFTRRIVDGKVISPENGDLIVEIIGDRIQFILKGELKTEWILTLDATKSPRTCDRKNVVGLEPAKTEKHGPVVALSIYRLDRDTLQIASTFGQGDQERPSDFEGKKQSESMYILKRAKR